jgi:uncharacterized membrane protein YfcA
MIEFPISGVETYWWLPIVVAFVISSLGAMGGVTGAFLLLPFQISVLGFSGPAVSPTNLLFNVIAIPGGVYRYGRERRMVWPLAWTIVVASLPGVFIGAIIRIKYLPDARSFKLFVAVVLLYLGIRLVADLVRKRIAVKQSGLKPAFRVSGSKVSGRAITYDFNGVSYSINTWKLAALCFVVGIVGGAYGIGGGAIIAPFLVAVFGLPVYSVAGATLFSTFVSSIGGVLFYTAVAPFVAADLTVTPDWLLGSLFGIGGVAGVYLGARMQRYVPERIIKCILAAAVLFVVAKYVIEFVS